MLVSHGCVCARVLSIERTQVRAASRPDEGFGLSAAQLGLGVGIYAWVAYYLCFFLPYRALYDEYQSYDRRTAQVPLPAWRACWRAGWRVDMRYRCCCCCRCLRWRYCCVWRFKAMYR